MVFSCGLLLLPLIAIFSPNGMVVLFAVMAVAMAAVARSQLDLRAIVRSPLALILGGLLAWSLVTAAWALEPFGSLDLWARFAVISLVGLVLLACARNLGAQGHGAIEKALMIGGATFLVLLAVEIVTDVAMTRMLRGLLADADNVRMVMISRGTMIFAIFFWPCAYAIWRNINSAAAVAFGLATGAALYFSPSSTALLAICVAGCVFAIVCYRPKPAITVLGVFVVVSVAVAPILTTYVISPEQVTSTFGDLPRNWQHRLYIWQFATEKIAERPIFGWGLDASRDIAGGSQVVANIAPAMPLHPHNAALQLWLELGVPGVAIVVVLLGNLFKGLAGSSLPPARIAVVAAMASAYLVIANIGFGLWQNWWLAVAWLMAAICIATTTWGGNQHAERG